NKRCSFCLYAHLYHLLLFHLPFHPKLQNHPDSAITQTTDLQSSGDSAPSFLLSQSLSSVALFLPILFLIQELFEFEDLSELIRFLVKRISESLKSGKVADRKNSSAGNKLRGDEEVVDDYSKVESKLNDLKMETQTPGTGNTRGDTSVSQANKGSDSVNDELNCVLNEKELAIGEIDAGRGIFGNEENPSPIGDGHLTVLQQKEKELVDEVTLRTSEVEHLERELEVMKAAAEMTFNNQQSVDFYLDQLTEQVHAKTNDLSTLESEWDAVRKPLEERKRTLEESLYLNSPDAQAMLHKLREVQQEEDFISSEIRKREEEHSKLLADLEKQQKVASRKSYTHRIEEITKNSRKQDADIERILKETREVQLESNSIQERLHRTYAVADEIVFREAKKDPTGLQVYKLLVNIHKGFEQISEKILATDRIRREVSEYEMKLAATPSTSQRLDVSELQSDLDIIIRENEYLDPLLQDK
uniref:Coiled-coil domain-containing protein 22 n=1 Tax=Cicer arietinum TaxID=3827 RepID=A0A1S3E5A2_CICAR